MQRKKEWLLNSILIIFLISLTAFFVFQNVNQENMIRQGNNTLFFATDGSLLRSEESENEQVKSMSVYFPETKLDDAQEREQYHILFNDAGYMQNMYEKARQNDHLVAAYDFYPQKRYSANFMFATKQKYIFNTSLNDEIVYAIGYRNNSTRREIINYYEYYPHTTLDEDITQKVQQIYYVNNKGNIEYSIELEENTGRELRKNLYEKNTKYDAENFVHKTKVIKSEPIDVV